MHQPRSLLCLISVVPALFLGACGGGTGIRITESSQDGPSTPVTAIARDEAYLVHIDEPERIATIRNGLDLPKGFVIAETNQGEQTAVLKMRPKTPRSRLRTADILEGNPEINNLVRKASKSRTRELRKTYRESSDDGTAN